MVATSALQRLFEVLGEPPSGVTPVPWDRALPEAGLRYPADYRAIVDRYGSFEVYQYLSVCGPSEHVGGFPRYAAWSLDEAENALLPENHSEPSPDGDLVTGSEVLQWWGGNIAGDRFFWLTVGEPDDWPIMIWYCGGPWQLFRTGLAQFLTDTITWALPEEDRVIPIQGPENPDWTPGEPVPPLLTPLGGWNDAVLVL